MENIVKPTVKSSAIVFSRRVDCFGAPVLTLLMTKNGSKYSLPEAVVKPGEDVSYAAYRGTKDCTGVKLKKAQFVKTYNMYDSRTQEWDIVNTHLSVVQEYTYPTNERAIWVDLYYYKEDDIDLLTIIETNRIIASNFDGKEVYIYPGSSFISKECFQALHDAFKKLQRNVKTKNTVFDFFPSGLDDDTAKKALAFRNIILCKPKAEKKKKRSKTKEIYIWSREPGIGHSRKFTKGMKRIEESE